MAGDTEKTMPAVSRSRLSVPCHVFRHRRPRQHRRGSRQCVGHRTTEHSPMLVGPRPSDGSPHPKRQLRQGYSIESSAKQRATHGLDYPLSVARGALQTRRKETGQICTLGRFTTTLFMCHIYALLLRTSSSATAAAILLQITRYTVS